VREQPSKHPLNVSGKYYVDFKRYINHGLCVFAAPNNFRLDKGDYGAYVFRQPELPEEEEQCRQAVEECPVGAVRDDGEISEVSSHLVAELPTQT
jgi:ferredoxin